MKIKVPYLKLKNSTLQDYDSICVEDIHNIIPVCDEVEEVIIEEYDEN